MKELDRPTAMLNLPCSQDCRRRCLNRLARRSLGLPWAGWVVVAGLLAWPLWAGRQVVSLNGEWQVAESLQGDVVPRAFPAVAPVPGLLDMARPGFPEVGQPSAKRRFFWYRRTFTLTNPPPAHVRLELHKAKYGSAVWLNGRLVAEHRPCFTPGEFEIKPWLRPPGETNELVIRVGADRSVLPPGQPSGWDFEKYRFLPGLYDSVELILCGEPRIANVQTVPDIHGRRVRVLAELEATPGLEVKLEAEVREVASGAQVAVGQTTAMVTQSDGRIVLDLTLPLSDCRLWSPEDPFLYELTLRTAGDETHTRFGMREFRFDPLTGRALLNGQVYYLRGSNFTVHRFFEDAARGNLPWDRQWVRQLHRKLKAMHWNTLRYTIGFPPDFWYDIADEEGWLIQDEFPIWLLSEAPEYPLAAKIIPEYTAWMRARWNHPCVVIWDGQNESVTPETGKAIQAVRHLDYSNRPWENGWGEPQSLADCVEAHPYLFIRRWLGQPPFRLEELAHLSARPPLVHGQNALPVPIIINEYAWLWLTREGQPTCLTEKVYADLLGPEATPQQRRELHALNLAALTEFWRTGRECAGVMHFCSLGYSRPGDRPRPEGGATSDHWTDIRRLQLEPLFEKYVRDAFNPVGLMVDFWATKAAAGQRRPIRVRLINDRNTPWQGAVTLAWLRSEQVLNPLTQPAALPPLGQTDLVFDVAFPEQPGRYLLQASLQDHGESIHSVRRVELFRP